MVCLWLAPLASRENVYNGKKITSVRFVGLRNVSTGDLESLLSLRPGTEFSTLALNEDIKVLFETGNFSAVVAKIEANADDTINLNFEVVELPRIEEVKFRGVEELYPVDLKQALGIREGNVYSDTKVRDGLRRLKDKYREEGFFHAEIWVKVSDLDVKSNTVSVTYVVDEGENIPISKINIIGARHLDPEEMLEQLEHKEEGTFEDGTFQENKFEDDKLKILAYAKSRGFIDAEIDEELSQYEIRWRNPSQPEEGRVVVVTYKLREGEIRFFGGYSFEHDRAAINQEANPPERKIKGPADIIPVVKAEIIGKLTEYNQSNIGEIFDESKFFRDRQLVQELYSQQGYVFTQVQPKFINYKLDESTIARYEACQAVENPTTDQGRVCKEEAARLDLAQARKRLEDNPRDSGRVLRHVHFVIRENGLAYIENIIIKGMVKTQERVIRRNLLIKEGQLFNSALVNRSREKLINLGYFKAVNLQMRPGSDDEKMNLIIDVEEQPTGTISMGGGFGTASGFSIFTEVGENNLNGTGQQISGRLEYGPLRRYLQLRWTDPWMYEKCEATTGSFWRNKQKAFDEAADLDSIALLADGLENDYKQYGDAIKAYVAETRDDSVESLDLVKARIRRLLSEFVFKEEDCFRSVPRPWSLSLSAFYASRIIVAPTIAISDDPNDLVEDSSYERTRVGVGVGVTHTFLLNWAHYHRYSPSWGISSRPTALVDDAVLRQVDLGWQFKSAVTNGLIYDTRDNVFNPTAGQNVDVSMEVVGQFLGGEDHYNQYNVSYSGYNWWFDYTFGGLFRKNSLRRWRVVQEFRLAGIFTHETAPWGSDQNKERNPFIEPEDRLFLGGFEALRGYGINDPNFPGPWRDGGSHMILASSELRFPIEPRVLWLAFFFDAGSLYDNVGEFTGQKKEDVDNYSENASLAAARTDGGSLLFFENYNPLTFKPYPYGFTDWNDPHRAVLAARNVSLDRFMYSWGVGLRVQIPVLPLRLFMAQKLYYAGGGTFKPIPGDDEFEFVFGIGDFRF